MTKEAIRKCKNTQKQEKDHKNFGETQFRLKQAVINKEALDEKNNNVHQQTSLNPSNKTNLVCLSFHR